MEFSCTTTYSKPRYNPGVRRIRKTKRTCEIETYFDEVFVHSDYQEKDEETLELNKARIPKLRSSKDDQMIDSCTAEETLVSNEEIGMQLQRKNPTKLCQSALWTLNLERRDRVPKAVLRDAKQLRAKLNPDVSFSDSSKLSKILSTKGYYVKGSKKLQPKLKQSLAKLSLNSSQQTSSSTSVSPPSHDATQTHPSAVDDREISTGTMGKTTDSEDKKRIPSGVIEKRPTRSGRIPKPPNRLYL